MACLDDDVVSKKMLSHEALFFLKKNLEVKLYLVLEVNAMPFFFQINAMPYKTWFRKKNHE